MIKAKLNVEREVIVPASSSMKIISTQVECMQNGFCGKFTGIGFETNFFCLLWETGSEK